MRKKIVLLFSCIIFIIVLCLYSWKAIKIETTNLTDISIDNIVLGDDFENVNLTKYTKVDGYDDNYNYRFNEIAINVDNGIIDGLFSNFDNNVVISINGNTDLTKVNDIKDILGGNFKDKWYDKEQGLKTYIYYDYNNNIKANFIYSNYDNNLVWIKLKKQTENSKNIN
ncbi:hypothetical protein [Sarcina ventriculi]